MVNEENGGGQAYPWAGPALFIAVAVLLAVFFYWFVRA